MVGNSVGRTRERHLVGLMGPDRREEVDLSDWHLNATDSPDMREAIARMKIIASEEGACIRSEGDQLHQIVDPPKAGEPFIDHYQWGRQEFSNSGEALHCIGGTIDKSGDFKTRTDTYDCFVNPDLKSPIAAITLHRIEESGKPSFLLSLLPRKGRSDELIKWVAATQAELAPSDFKYTATLFNEEVATLLAEKVGPIERAQISYAKLFSLNPIRQFPRSDVNAQIALLEHLSDDPILSDSPAIREAIVQSIYNEVSHSKQAALSQVFKHLTQEHAR